MSRNRQWFRCVLLVLAIWVPLSECGVKLNASAMAQTILYVDDDAPSGGDGSSWDLAFDDLQDALTIAADPKNGVTETRVGQGEYVPSQRTDEGDPRSVTFTLISGVTLAGAYAGYGAKDGDERDFEKWVSTLSGDINGDDGPDFANYGENAYHVVVGSGTDATAVLDGLAIMGGNADLGTLIPPAMTRLGGGLLCIEGSPTITHCWFADNLAENGAGIAWLGSPKAQASYCIFERNHAIGNGGGASCEAFADKDVVSCALDHCVFAENTSITGGAFCGKRCNSTITECSFVQNRSSGGGGGAVTVAKSDLTLADSLFVANTCELGAGALSVGGASLVVTHCVFDSNTGGYGGAVHHLGLDSVGTATFSECAFTRNSASYGGGMFVASAVTMVNCTIAQNTGSGVQITNSGAGSLDATNCVFYNNTSAQIDEYFGGPPTFDGVSATVSNSCIQNGWPGVGNTDANPFFIQPGCGNFRLGVGSPCIDSGNNGAIPAGVTTDLDGKPRIINGTVDMGAYEGEDEMLPPAACEDDIDEGEFQLLVIGGGPNKPVEKSAIAVSNDAGGDNSYVNVTQVEADVHSGAGGFTELGHILTVDTSLPNGAYFMRVSVPFDESNLNGFDPFDLDLTSFDPASGDWGLAVEFNVQSSPDHKGPVGDRILVEGEAWQGSWTFDVGDYGVFWNPSEQRGFAWANVDHATDFAFGVSYPSCAGDVTYPGDHVVDTSDLTALLDAWGTTPLGPANFADFDHNGVVDVDDLLALING